MRKKRKHWKVEFLGNFVKEKMNKITKNIKSFYLIFGLKILLSVLLVTKVSKKIQSNFLVFLTPFLGIVPISLS